MTSNTHSHTTAAALSDDALIHAHDAAYDRNLRANANSKVYSFPVINGIMAGTLAGAALGLASVGATVAAGMASSGPLLNNPIAMGVIAVGTAVGVVAGAWLGGVQLPQDARNELAHSNEEMSSVSATLSNRPDLAESLQRRREQSQSLLNDELEQNRERSQRVRNGLIMGALIGK